MVFDPFSIYDAGNPNLLWALEIDWDNDGDFEANESHDRLTAFEVKRGRDYFIRPEGNGFEPYAPGFALFTLDNWDGKYTPKNTDSPLYPNVTKGKFMQWRVKDTGTGTVKTVFTGKVYDIVPAEKSDWSTVTLVCHDGIKDAIETRVDTRAATVNNQTVDDQMDKVLDAMQWPTRWGRDLDSGITVFSISDNLPLGADDAPAWQLLDSLAALDLGRVFVNVAGQMQFVNRLDGAASVLTVNQADLLKDLEEFNPREADRNIIQVNVNVRGGASGTMFSLGDPLFVAAGDSIKFFANYTLSGARVVEENPGGTQAANSASDGSGVDLTSDFTITKNYYSTRALIEVTNNGTLDGYLTTFTITGGDPIKQKYIIERTGTGSSTDPRVFVYDNFYMSSLEVGRDYADFLADWLTTLGPFYRASYLNHFDKQFELDIFDPATLNLARYGQSGARYRVGSIEHRSLNPTLQVIQTILTFEPYFDISDWWIYTVQMGINSKFTF